MISVQRINENGLSKQEWNFEYKYGKLQYVSHYLYNRSSKKAKWADELSSMSYSDWVVKFGTDDEEFDNDAYEEYLRINNPISQTTRQGKSKLSGICAPISNMPKCPDDVAKEARQKFIKQVKVLWK